MAKKKYPPTAHKQTCPQCIWLGTIPHVNLTVQNPADLYYCHQDGKLKARYGSRDPLWSVHPQDAPDQNIPEMIVALDLAIRVGVITGDGEPMKPVAKKTDGAEQPW